MKSIDKSEAALKTWRDKTTGLKRSQIISRWSELIKENCDDLGEGSFSGGQIGDKSLLLCFT